MGRELRSRYRGSILGASWILLQPLLYLVVYFVVFVKILEFKIELGGGGWVSDHPLAGEFARRKTEILSLSMFVGLIPWIAFSETLQRAAGCVMENGNLIKKYSFPAELLPVYLVGVGLFNAVIAFGILTIAVFFLVGGLPAFVWMFPVLLALQALFTLGFCYLISALAVYVRDIMQTLPMILTFWFFLSPIFYLTKVPRTDADPTFMWLVDYNPMRYLIETYREMFLLYPGIQPGTAVGGVPWDFILIFAAISIPVFLLGYGVFMRLRPRFADEV